MYNPLKRHGRKVTAADKAADIFATVLATGFFWGYALYAGVLDHALQGHSVLAQNPAVVTHVYQGRGSSTRVEFTTNTGQRVRTSLGFQLTPCCDVKRGDLVKVQYVSYDSDQAYPAGYRPQYHKTMIFGSIALGIWMLAAWSIPKEWAARNQEAAANAAGTL